MSQTRVYTTNEAADITRHRPQTYRREYCVKGHFNGIKPVKLPGGRLLWPADKIDALVRGESAEVRPAYAANRDDAVAAPQQGAIKTGEGA